MLGYEPGAGEHSSKTRRIKLPTRKKFSHSHLVCDSVVRVLSPYSSGVPKIAGHDGSWLKCQNVVPVRI